MNVHASHLVVMQHNIFIFFDLRVHEVTPQKKPRQVLENRQK